MRAVKNKSNRLCACSLITGLQGRGKYKYKLTNADCDVIASFEEGLNKYCLIDQRGHCDEDVQGHHTTLGIRWIGHCKRCDGNVWEVLPHPPRTGNRLYSRREHGSSHLLRLPVPVLEFPTAEDIAVENIEMRENEGEDDYFE